MLTYKQEEIIDRLELIVNSFKGIDVTLKQVIDDNAHFLRYKIGNVNAEVHMNMLTQVCDGGVDIVHADRFYRSIDTNKLMNDLNLTELEIYTSVFRLQSLGFVKAVSEGADLYILFDSVCIKDFVNIGRERLRVRVNTFKN